MATDLADAVESLWESEPIPDADLLYMRIQRMWIEDGEPMPAAFRLRSGETGMSTDWNKYSTAQESRQRGKIPEDNMIISMKVGDVRRIPGQEVIHTPIPSNRAHTDVTGVKDTEARARFTEIYTIVIPIE